MRNELAGAFIPFLFLLTLLLCSDALNSSATAASPVSFKTPPGIQDAVEWPRPGEVQVNGWLGLRIRANATNRLLTIDTEPLLAGFRQKPGSHPWIGEHIGKWMHAASLAWAYTRDPRLKTKLDQVAGELIAAQEPNGYLGTYVPDKRFGLFPGADWDVWSHKYNLIGLLSYYQYTGNEEALSACRKIGDLLIETFGDDKKSILSAGTHVGMAATSVLEPMVLLYRFTGEAKYLEFCRYLVRSWDEPEGPKIIQTLLAEGRVNRTANAKAYEMLSNLVGLCELARATGDRELLRPVLSAWNDIVAKRLYVTGSASQGEHFRDDHSLPNETGAHVAETCVTTTWIQLNSQLLRLTGEARFANELEKTFYNHLAAAQHPQGGDWCYFTALSGRKPYEAGINCCHSSGPRGMALAPWHAYLVQRGTQADTLLVSTFEDSSARLHLNGAAVNVTQSTRFPLAGGSELQFDGPEDIEFAVGVRVPAWIKGLTLRVNSEKVKTDLADGWLRAPARRWSKGDKLHLEYVLTPSLEPGEHGNKGMAALKWGPFVMAFDSGMNPEKAPPTAIAFARKAEPRLISGEGLSPRITANVRSRSNEDPTPAVFVPFADAGAGGGSYRVWIPGPDATLEKSGSVLLDGEEGRSRAGNVQGSINDGDRGSFVVTFDGRKAARDWFEVILARPETIRRVVFVNGNIFHDGGWFDTSEGKPRLQVRRAANGPWERVAELEEYPETTATDPANLENSANRVFEVRLPKAEKVVAVRVEGRPATGDNPNQAFASCAELEAYAE